MEGENVSLFSGGEHIGDLIGAVSRHCASADNDVHAESVTYLSDFSADRAIANDGKSLSCQLCGRYRKI